MKVGLFSFKDNVSLESGIKTDISKTTRFFLFSSITLRYITNQSGFDFTCLDFGQSLDMFTKKFPLSIILFYAQ